MEGIGPVAEPQETDRRTSVLDKNAEEPLDGMEGIEIGASVIDKNAQEPSDVMAAIELLADTNDADRKTSVIANNGKEFLEGMEVIDKQAEPEVTDHTPSVLENKAKESMEGMEGIHQLAESAEFVDKTSLNTTTDDQMKSKKTDRIAPVDRQEALEDLDSAVKPGLYPEMSEVANLPLESVVIVPANTSIEGAESQKLVCADDGVELNNRNILNKSMADKETPAKDLMTVEDNVEKLENPALSTNKFQEAIQEEGKLQDFAKTSDRKTSELVLPNENDAEDTGSYLFDAESSEEEEGTIDDAKDIQFKFP